MYTPDLLSPTLDPTLVFGEFMGVIKGSEQALEKEEGYLDKNTYLNLSSRTKSTFASQRDTIYRLFKAYLTFECKVNAFDDIGVL